MQEPRIQSVDDAVPLVQRAMLQSGLGLVPYAKLHGVPTKGKTRKKIYRDLAEMIFAEDLQKACNC
jgi:hypothetical protein